MRQLDITRWRNPGRIATLLFGLSGLLCLISLQFDLLPLRLLTKWMPALVLAVWVWQFAQGKPRIFAATGLILSALGDLTLEGNYVVTATEIPWFAIGLGFFLLAHVFYVLLFLSLPHHLRWQRMLPVAVFIGSILLMLWESLGAMRAPVIAYMSVISVMVWAAVCVRPATLRTDLWRWCAAWGAICFALSDSMIAINKFVAPFAGAREAILLTYWFAQFGIASAAVNYPQATLSDRTAPQTLPNTP